MSGPREPLRVLVVEDDEVARAALRTAIAALGHACDVARNGAEAWRSVSDGAVDVVVSDWRMPVMDGLELCRRIRAEELSRYVYFIFTTAFDDRAHFVEGTRAGADDYLAKPVDLDELEARLGSASRVLGLHRRLAEANARLQKDSARARESARTDPLTNAANRLRMSEDLEALRARAARYGHRYCAALCDVDFFKAFNDEHGHLAGDEALRAVADTIRRELRRGDALYRYGGEEFLVVLPEQAIEEARAAMDRVRVAVQRGTGVTISVGVAQLAPADDGAWGPWLARADAALYVAKGNGRNRVECAPSPG